MLQRKNDPVYPSGMDIAIHYVCPHCLKTVRVPPTPKEVSINCPYCKERFALVLLSRDSDYAGIIRTVQERLQIDDYTAAKALVDHVPALLRRDMTYEEAAELVRYFQPNATVKLVQDRGSSDEELLSAREVSLPAQEEEKHGLGFGGTVAAVIVGVVAAVLLLSIL